MNEAVPEGRQVRGGTEGETGGVFLNSVQSLLGRLNQVYTRLDQEHARLQGEYSAVATLIDDAYEERERVRGVIQGLESLESWLMSEN